MGLKQSIVIKSEFTNNTRSRDGGGSRGGSPGQYVMRYMAREDATEVLSPVRLDGSDFDGLLFSRYMARSEATEKIKNRDDDLLNDVDAYGSPHVLKHRFRKIDQLSGRAFGSRGISLSHQELLDSSEIIQKAFDVGHSVQKIVLSFDETYLKETGVIPQQFKHRGRGSYKGFVDQLKLRSAITKGVSDMVKMGRFVSPEWVGTIQFDTSYVHAHIALVDTVFSEFRMRNDGSDRGKINEREKKMLRKGIHFGLEDMSDLKLFNQQLSLERQNVVAFVKDNAYSTLSKNTGMQLLIASLPKERKDWRYKSRNRNMIKPNELAKDLVELTFSEEPVKSGFSRAMMAVYDYADESQRKNQLTNQERENLVIVGRERLLERSVNGLYADIAKIDDRDLYVRTTMIDLQSSSDDELKSALASHTVSPDTFDPVAFALRVRGYNKRQDLHVKSAETFYKLLREFDVANDAALVDSSAHVMRLYYEEELLYHMGLADKYRTFLTFNPDRDRVAVQKAQPEYRRLCERFDVLSTSNQNDMLTKQYNRNLSDYTFNCFMLGVGSRKEWSLISNYNLDEKEFGVRTVLPIRPKGRIENLTEEHFKEVKSLDVHHLGLDYYNRIDTHIDSFNAVNFAKSFEDRRYVLMLAKGYIDRTGQHLDVVDESERDIMAMEGVVKKAIDEGLIDVVTLDDLAPVDKRQLYTVCVDNSIDVSSGVKRALLVDDAFDVIVDL